MTVTLVNLTPHPLVLILDSGEKREIPPAAEPARVVDRHEASTIIDTDAGHVELADVALGAEVVGLPPPRDGVLLVVSRVTAGKARRADVVFPLEEVRDGDGRIVGCRVLGRFASR